MAAQRADVTRLLARVQQAGASNFQDDPSAKGELLHTLDVLKREIEGPAAYLSRVRQAPLLNMCQLMAIEMGLLGAIVKRKGQSVDAHTLANDINRDELLIVRIMRLLTVHGFCDETSVRQYRSNANAELLNTPGMMGATRNMVELLYPIGGKLKPLLRETKAAGQAPSDLQSPYKYTFGTSLFDYLEKDAEHKVYFDDWMSSRRAGLRREWFDLYPIESRLVAGTDQSREAVFLVDVAGGKGHDISRLNSRFPGLPGRLVVQDLPRTFENYVAPEGIEANAHDIFTKQPIEGARTYFFRSVFHDWPEFRSLDILAHTAHAMKPGYSRLLIEDLVLPDRGADMRQASLDMTMYFMPEGIERTAGQWKDLLERAGLQIIKIWSDGSGMESVIEAELEGTMRTPS
ncbi:hypothetical protein MMC22_004784 [Lobaria immixta]|nr:hypothetical protein [Lobaria immixta]